MRKKLWLGMLCALLCFACIVMGWLEHSSVCGLQVLSKDKLLEMTENMEYVKSAEGIGELLQFEGQAIPYDDITKTFYISQDVKKKRYQGIISGTVNDCDIYIEEIDDIYSKERTISKGSILQVWILVGDTYTKCNLIFSGIPILALDSEQQPDYSHGEIVLYNPNDSELGQMSIKTSAAEIKENMNSGTVTIKLCKDNYLDERKLSLLAMGKERSWKLYTVSDKDDTCVRAILAAEIWNTVTRDKRRVRPYRFIEVIINNEYAGLYLMAPKVTPSYLELSENSFLCSYEENTSFVVVDEEVSEDIQEIITEYVEWLRREKDDVNSFDLNSYIDYNIFEQIIFGVKNISESKYLIAEPMKGTLVYSVMPERLEYCFGCLPNSLDYLSWQGEKRVVEDIEYQLLCEKYPEAITHNTIAYWNELYAGSLSSKYIQELAEKHEQFLREGGYIDRSGRAENYETACERLDEYINDRMYALNEYFSNAGAKDEN